MKARRLLGHYEPLAPEINVTPLVDVVLVLLIIFMLVVPQMQHDKAVELPRARNVDPAPPRVAEPWKLTILRDGAMFFGEEPVETSGLAEKLNNLRVEDPSRRLVVRSDSGVPWWVVRSVLAEIQKAGFIGASLGVAEAPSAESATQETKGE